MPTKCYVQKPKRKTPNGRPKLFLWLQILSSVPCPIYKTFIAKTTNEGE
jgi:hypothetical protein